MFSKGKYLEYVFERYFKMKSCEIAFDNILIKI